MKNNIHPDSHLAKMQKNQNELRLLKNRFIITSTWITIIGISITVAILIFKSL